MQTVGLYICGVSEQTELKIQSQNSGYPWLALWTGRGGRETHVTQVYTYMKSQAVHLRSVHYMYLTVQVASEKKSLKEDAYFHAMQTTPIKQAGLSVPCCSDQDVRLTC